MKTRYELLNFATGIILVISGILALFQRQLMTGMGWIIFGSMYLVMDDYIPKIDSQDFFSIILNLGRKIFSYVGLIGSIVVLIYFITA